MRHSEVAQTPRKTRNDVLRRSLEGIDIEFTDSACSFCEGKGEVCGIRIFSRNNHDGYCKNGNEHHQTLEKVGPANCLEAAREGVRNNNEGENQKRKLIFARKLRNNACQNRFTGNEARGNI